MSEYDNPRVFGYARASTKKQVESPDTQKGIIAKYAEFHDMGEVAYYVDSAASGKTSWHLRESGAELMKAVRRGDHVVIAKLDRAFRKLSDCVAVLEKFERMGVNLHVCNLMGGAIDLSSSMGKFIIHVLAAFAELERSFISERTKDGLAKRKKAGVKHSRFPGYGYRWEKQPGSSKPVRVPDEQERLVMKSILEWRTAENHSWEQIRDHLNRVLELTPKNGGEYDLNLVKRLARAELNLQLDAAALNGSHP